jgi:hypothetical protein
VCDPSLGPIALLLWLLPLRTPCLSRTSCLCCGAAAASPSPSSAPSADTGASVDVHARLGVIGQLVGGEYASSLLTDLCGVRAQRVREAHQQHVVQLPDQRAAHEHVPQHQDPKGGPHRQPHHGHPSHASHAPTAGSPPPCLTTIRSTPSLCPRWSVCGTRWTPWPC